MSSDSVIRKAEKRVKAKKGFYVHLGSFISVGVFFLLMNFFTYDGEWWFFFPLLPWLVGVLIHYFVTFGFPGTDILTEGWEERQLEKEVRAILQKGGGFPRNETEMNKELPLPDDRLELPDPEKIPEKRWSDKDFV